jgi:hypothetical protein
MTWSFRWTSDGSLDGRDLEQRKMSHLSEMCCNAWISCIMMAERAGEAPII